MKMKLIAKFMGMKVSPITNVDVTYFLEGKPFELYTFDPYTDANDTLLVEAKLREDWDLWGRYAKALRGVIEKETLLMVSEAMVLSATLEQRMTAAIQVIQEHGDE